MIQERQAMNSYNPDENQGALERLGIPVQTTPPEQILTTGKANSIKFRISRPHGYAYGDVESYNFDYVIPTLEWYAEALHQRDLAVHKLGELVDKLEVDLLNAKAQLDNKEVNDTIGLAVEESERDEEMLRLLDRVNQLQEELNNAHAALQQAGNAPISSPDGEETYTREEVEGFLASAVEDANNERDAHFQSVLQQREQEFAAQLQQARAEAASSAQPAEDTYTEEEVEAAVQEAVTKAVQDTEEAKDAEYKSVIDSHLAALEEAEQRLQEAANTPTGYTEEEVAAAIAHAVAEKEAELLANLSQNTTPSVDDEELLALRAENKRLREDAVQMDEYTRQLDAYIESLEGRTAAPQESALPQPDTGRPLPKIRPEDL